MDRSSGGHSLPLADHRRRAARRVAFFAGALILLLPGAAGKADSPAPAGGAPLRQPAVYHSSHGKLNVSLVVSERRVPIAGQQVLAKVYNGSFVAPTLVVRPGDLIRVRLVNHLREPTNLHFHGLEVSPSGHADNIFLSVNPGRSFQYSFRLPRTAATGTFWYHSHEMPMTAAARSAAIRWTGRPLVRFLCNLAQMSPVARYPNTGTEEQVFDGLSGVLEVEGIRNDLPRRLRNVTERYLALRDVQVAGGQIVSSDIDSNAPTTRLVDGQLDPRITIAPGQTQLWHIANIGADIFYDLALPGHTFDVVAQDGHPVLHARQARTLVLPPGKRYDVLVRGGARGTSPLRTLYFDQHEDHYPARTLATVLTTGRPQAATRLPNVISWGSVDLRRARLARKRVVVFSENRAGTRFFIDGEYYDPTKINFHAKLGTVEQWTIVNHSEEVHAFHMHTYPMQVVSVNGVPSTFNGYQDVTDLPSHGYIVVRIRFEGFAGVTVFHCHILSHEDAGMMANIEVSK
jgi:FtsP/CotA-like multicopper oxidase with cupredoxin domain